MLCSAALRPAFRASSSAARCRCLAASSYSSSSSLASLQAYRNSRRTLFTGRGGSRATQDFDLNKLNDKRRDYEQNRTAFLAAGALAGIVSFVYTAWKLKEALNLQNEKEKIAVKCDSNGAIPSEIFKTEAGEKRKIVVHDEDGRAIVPTGNSTVPAFPLTLDVTLPHSPPDASQPIASAVAGKQGTEFTLVGLGMRTVTFIGIQVYLVGFYVATQDLDKLQKYLIRKINPQATTLIPSEKDALRQALLDATEGEQTWDALLKDAGCSSVFRITPVRDTDFHHLRDGFVRAVAARSQYNKQTYGDEEFGAAMKDFKTMFNRGSVPKKQEMLLTRDAAGRLAVMYGPKRELVGTVEDERLSRLLWLNYLAGNKVASEPARQNIIEGVMELVGRPVGTAATQVV